MSDEIQNFRGRIAERRGFPTMSDAMDSVAADAMDSVAAADLKQ